MMDLIMVCLQIMLEALTNDFFTNILDFTYTWSSTSEDNNLFEGRDRRTGEMKF